MSRPLQLLDLPNDVLLYILSYLPTLSLLRASHACRHFLALSHAPSLHHPLFRSVWGPSGRPAITIPLRDYRFRILRGIHRAFRADALDRTHDLKSVFGGCWNPCTGELYTLLLEEPIPPGSHRKVGWNYCVTTDATEADPRWRKKRERINIWEVDIAEWEFGLARLKEGPKDWKRRDEAWKWFFQADVETDDETDEETGQADEDTDTETLMDTDADTDTETIMDTDADTDTETIMDTDADTEVESTVDGSDDDVAMM